MQMGLLKESSPAYSITLIFFFVNTKPPRQRWFCVGLFMKDLF